MFRKMVVISQPNSSRVGRSYETNAMKQYLRYLLSLLAVAFTAPAILADSPRIHEYIFNVGQFNDIRVLDNVNVVYRCVPDSSGYVAYRGEKDFADSFILSNNKGTLRIQVTTEDVNKPGLPTIYAYSDFLSNAENSSDFTLKVESPAPCAEFRAKQVGNGNVVVENIKATTVKAGLTAGLGNVVLSGSCREAELKMVGTGMISADRLKAETVKCTILGSGSIGCWPTELLQTKGIGSTKIYYKGDPNIKKSGGGKIYPLPSNPGETFTPGEESDDNLDPEED